MRYPVILGLYEVPLILGDSQIGSSLQGHQAVWMES